MSLPKAIIQSALARFGYQIRKLEYLKPSGGHYDPTTPLPADADTALRVDHPWLRELERRYQAFESPLAKHTIWNLALTNKDRDVKYFRGDNGFLWAYRSLGDMQRRFYIYGQYIKALDRHGLLGGKLVEDGAFGCFTYHYQNLPTLSRDLLDSLNELYFLDRHLQLLTRTGIRVLDIGAGFGRLAHRMLSATDGVERYWCLDAIPRSTFVCDYYLRHRGLAGAPESRAIIVPLDEIETAITPGTVDLAVNVHSFSEMNHDAIAGWIDYLVRMEIPRLFIVPNTTELTSTEVDYSHQDFAPLLDRAGFRRVAHEPTMLDPDVRDLVGVSDNFWLFERS